jgi:hypothetical protein
MKSLAPRLLALQDLKFGPSSPDVGQRIEALRKTLPESLLVQFDRWMARRRKAVAVVRNGVCSECHIQIAVGILGALTFSEEIQRCGSCGRFLYLPEDEPVYPPPPAPQAKPAPRRKKATTHVR